MIHMESFMGLSSGPWYVDLGVLAGALASLGVIWRMAIWPALRALWAAIIAAPKIAEGVGEVVHLIESDVLGKLEDIKADSAVHLEQANARDRRIDHHTLQIENHELRLGKLEQVHRERLNEGD